MAGAIGEAIMSKAITEENMALLKEANEMFNETGCVPRIDGEQVPAERIVPDVKEYLEDDRGSKQSTTRRYGIHLALR
jgi:hypothetical protein